MKLLKSAARCRASDGGNVKTAATLVEVQWLEFRTGVRFPSSPFTGPVHKGPAFFMTIESSRSVLSIVPEVSERSRIFPY